MTGKRARLHDVKAVFARRGLDLQRRGALPWTSIESPVITWGNAGSGAAEVLVVNFSGTGVKTQIRLFECSPCCGDGVCDFGDCSADCA